VGTRRLVLLVALVTALQAAGPQAGSPGMCRTWWQGWPRPAGIPLGVRRPVGMGAVRRRPWYLRAGALIAAMVILVIVPAVLLAADAVAAGPGRSPATACRNIAPE
jgi:hypothetical protein